MGSLPPGQGSLPGGWPAFRGGRLTRWITRPCLAALTVLAYQFVQIIRRRLQEKGIAGSWASLRATARVQRRVTVTFRRADARLLHVRKATQPEAELAAIYAALGVSLTPGHLEKTIV